MVEDEQDTLSQIMQQLEALKEDNMKLKEELNTTRAEVKAFDFNSLSALGLADNAKDDISMHIKEELVLENGLPRKVYVADFRVPERSHGLIQLVTLSLVLRHKKFKNEFAKFFKERYIEKNQPLPFSSKVVEILVSRGILSEDHLKHINLSFLQELITSIYSEKEYIEILEELKKDGKLEEYGLSKRI